MKVVDALFSAGKDELDHRGGAEGSCRGTGIWNW